MNKAIVLVLALFLTAQCFNPNVTDADALQFLEGFGPAVGQPNATDVLVNCTQTQGGDALDALKDVIQDLQQKNLTGAYDNFMDFIQAVNVMRATCPAGAEPFYDEFEPALAAWNASKKDFLDSVTRDLARDPSGAAEDVFSLGLALDGEDYYNAGGAFGNLTTIALAAYLNNTPIVESDNFVFDVEITDDGSSSEGSATEFFEGFASAFGLQDAAQAIMQCVENDPVSLFSDIENLINDISNSNWGAVVTDLIQVYDDIDNMVSECPDGANPFINEFQPVIEELSSDSSEFWSTVGDNIKGHLGDLLGDVGNIIQEISESEWSQAGEDFGNIFFVTLAGILPNSSKTTYEDVFAVAEISGESTDGSSSEGSATEFFEGFASAFGLQDAAQAIIQCVENDPVSLFSDIENLINDISNSNWGAVVTDLIQVYDDIDNMVSECPDGANPFINEFQPVIEELSSDSSEFWSTVGDNIKGHLGDLLGDVGNIIQEISESEWSQAGEDFGNIFFVTLAGILPNSTQLHH